MYTVTLSGSRGSELPLAKSIRLRLCFMAFLYRLKVQEQQLQYAIPAASRSLPAISSSSLPTRLLSSSSIWLCSLVLNPVCLLRLSCFVNFGSQKYELVPLSWWFQYGEVSHFKIMIFRWSLGVEVTLVLCHHSPARLCPSSYCNVFLLMRNAGLWSFSCRWRTDKYCAQCPLSWSPLALKPSSDGGGLTNLSNRLQGTQFFCHPLKSSFDQRSYSVSSPVFGSQRRQMNQLVAESASRDATNMYLSAKKTFLVSISHTSKTPFERRVISLWDACLLDAGRKIWCEHNLSGSWSPERYRQESQRKYLFTPQMVYNSYWLQL